MDARSGSRRRRSPGCSAASSCASSRTTRSSTRPAYPAPAIGFSGRATKRRTTSEQHPDAHGARVPRATPSARSRRSRLRRSLRRAAQPALAAADQRRRGARAARALARRSTRRAARSSTTSPIRRGTPGSSATSTRICPRARARSTRCCRRPSSSRSSSSTARSSRRSTSSGSTRFTLIDPACGSGHFLLGAFAPAARSLARARAGHGRARPRRARACSAVAASTSTRSRSRSPASGCSSPRCGLRRQHASRDAPDFKIEHRRRRLAAARHHGATGSIVGAAGDPQRPRARLRDRGRATICAGSSAASTTSSSATRRTSRRRTRRSTRRTGSLTRRASGKYALTVPFMERFFDLAMPAEDAAPAGFVGQITAQLLHEARVRQELIEEFLPKLDLTLVVDTCGAYIPGHGTPTVILVGRPPPVAPTVRTRDGHPRRASTPADPALRSSSGRAILAQVDRPGSQSAYVSVADVARTGLTTHPWSLGGGGASELRSVSRRTLTLPLSSACGSVGCCCRDRRGRSLRA